MAYVDLNNPLNWIKAFSSGSNPMVGAQSSPFKQPNAPSNQRVVQPTPTSYGAQASRSTGPSLPATAGSYALPQTGSPFTGGPVNFVNSMLSFAQPKQQAAGDDTRYQPGPHDPNAPAPTPETPPATPPAAQPPPAATPPTPETPPTPPTPGAPAATTPDESAMKYGPMPHELRASGDLTQQHPAAPAGPKVETVNFNGSQWQIHPVGQRDSDGGYSGKFVPTGVDLNKNPINGFADAYVDKFGNIRINHYPGANGPSDQYHDTGGWLDIGHVGNNTGTQMTPSPSPGGTNAPGGAVSTAPQGPTAAPTPSAPVAPPQPTTPVTPFGNASGYVAPTASMATSAQGSGLAGGGGSVQFTSGPQADGGRYANIGGVPYYVDNFGNILDPRNGWKQLGHL